MEERSEPTRETGPHYEPIQKSGGVTPAEKYLGRLCEKTFLSLWSYPGVYRDQGNLQTGGQGKEICDLLVVFGDDVIIFSDKQCQFKNSGNTELNWQRWFRRAIQKSVEQAWGAERWMRQNPARVFLDRTCTKRLPIELPVVNQARFHLIVVAHGVFTRIRQEYNGSGSLMIDTEIKGLGMHTKPFYVGDLDPQRTFVHVLDDESLHTLMSVRDTISDFVAYLTKRADLFRNRTPLVATGEEELLALYLRNLNENEEHDFVFPDNSGKPATHLCLTEGRWEHFQTSPERIQQLRRDEISYLWDHLIETFNLHALRGDQHFVSPGGIKDAEKILRFMAREPRWKRSHFSRIFADMLKTTPDTRQRVGVIRAVEKHDPHYLFVLFPIPSSPVVPYEHYREVRLAFLEACCKIVRLKYPDAKDIVGIATEPGINNRGRSEDAAYSDARGWNSEMETQARDLQEKLGVLETPKQQNIHIREYPKVQKSELKLKNYRNKPCPCGSGKKYKHCCLK